MLKPLKNLKDRFNERYTINKPAVAVAIFFLTASCVDSYFISKAPQKRESCNNFVKTMTPDLRAEFDHVAQTLQNNYGATLKHVEITFDKDTKHGLATCSTPIQGPQQ